MPYRKLLLPLSQTPSGRSALSLAVRLAKNWGAHICAVIARVDAASVAPLAGEGLSGAMIEDMMAATERESTAHVGALKAMFTARMAEAGIELTVPSGPTSAATASVLTVTGREEEIMPGLARLSDLTILPHAGQPDDPGAGSSLHAVLFESGRPVLIAPATLAEKSGQRCSIAWNGTSESAAALAGILPWLQHAEAIQILHAPEYQRRGPDAAAVLHYLALHGVAAKCALFHPIDRDVGAGLLAAAHAFGADLLGMGAYSHSRLRQMILGGVTRHVLHHAAIPVLMAH